jgi:proton-dependent oligopeptide transporter, POT family
MSDAASATRSPEGYRTVPDQNDPGWPAGVPYIVGNEVCERFSFYGMRAILKVHLVSLFTVFYTTQAVLSDSKAVKEAAEASATGVVHLFFAGVYALPMIGAIMADRLFGKYRTILYLSLIYCAGHAVLSLCDNYLMGMYVGLALIAVGSGGIKPCVSANVGDQFGKANWHRVRLIYQVFYFSINFGSFFATILIPITKASSGYWVENWFPGITEGMTEAGRTAYLDRLSTQIAFGIPGVLMFIATVIFWMGRHKFVHVPPKPGGKVGLLDVLSSTCLFMSVGHFFFTPAILKEQGADLATQLVVNCAMTAVFLALGLMLFAKRQREHPDDGFLAITLYTLKQWITGNSRPASGELPLARSRFWGPAVEKFGVEATEGPVAVFKIISVFFLVSVFWALFDQKATTWLRQAEQMDLSIFPGSETKLKATQTIAANPLLV